MTNDRFRIGFMPLVDAALPILAREMGFAEDENIDLELARDVSWATVCDRLLYGHTDGAHMLAPLAIAASLGLGRPAVPLSVPFVLGLNGNAVTLRPEIASKIVVDDNLGDIRALGERFATLARDRAKADKKLRLGVVHRYSSHSYMLRYWLQASGLDPNEDVEISVISPPFAADALAAHEVDGICVGEPWNSLAVDRGDGVIVAVTSQIWRRGVEKVLAIPSSRLETDTELVKRLIRALYRAGEAFIDADRLGEVSAILARKDYLDGPQRLIERAISDRITFAAGKPPVHIPDFMFQHREAANFPWVSQAAWLYTQMVFAGHVEKSVAGYAAAQACFRPDIYRAALAGTGAALPGANAKLEGGIETPLGVGTVEGRLILGPDAFFDGRAFDPDQLDAYLAEQHGIAE